MNHFHGRTLFASLLIFNALSSAAAEETLLPAVVVSSKGEEENYMEIPARVETATGKAVEKDRVRFVGEALNRIPGIFTREINNGVPSIGIRMPANTSTPYYLLTHDGIPMVSAISLSHESPSRMTFATAPGAFEVLKGPVSILYGSSAISAVIDERSPQPSVDLDRRAGVEVGERGFQRYKLQSSHVVDSQQSYYAAGSFTKNNGWRDKMKSTRGQVFGRYDYKFESGDELKTVFIGSINNIQQAGYLTAAQMENDRTASGLTLDDPFSKNNYGRLSSEWKHRLNDQTTLTVSPYIRRDDSSLIAFWNSTTLPENDTSVSTAGLRSAVKFALGNSETTIGIDGEYTKFHYIEEQTLPTVTSGSSQLPKGVHYDYGVEYTTISPFLNHTWFFSKDWRWDIGVRADYAHFAYDNYAQEGTCDATLNTNGKCGVYLRVPKRTDTFRNVGPKTGVSYQVNSQMSVFANAGQSFRIPTAGDLYLLKTTNQFPVLSAEKAYSFEVGYKFNSPALGIDLSLYQIDIKDHIVKTAATVNELASSTNAGKSRHQGLELGAAVKFSPDLLLHTAAAFSKNYFVDYTYSGINYSEKNQALAPTQVYNSRIIYTPGFLTGFEGSLEWNRIGNYWVEDANLNLQDGHNIFNVRTDYEVNKSLSLNARVMNLADTRYAADVQNTTGTSTGTLKYRPGSPRTLYIGMEYRL